MDTKLALAALCPTVVALIASAPSDSRDEDSLPDAGLVPGTHGRVRIVRTRTVDHPAERWETTVVLDGVPAWRRTEERWWSLRHAEKQRAVSTAWLDFAAEWAAVLGARASRRIRHQGYLAALDRAAVEVTEGRPLRYVPGQEGGYFILRLVGGGDGEGWSYTLSARGLRRRLGLPAIPVWGEEWDSWTAQVQAGERGDQPRRIPRKAGWKEVELAA